MTSLEGRVLRRRRGVEPPDGARGELEVLRGLAVRLGQPAHRFPVEPREVFDELRAASAVAARTMRASPTTVSMRGRCCTGRVPTSGIPGRPAVPRPLRHRRREGSVHRRRASGSGRSAGRGLPTGRDHGTCSRALSIRRADPPVAELASAAGSMFVQVHPDTAARAGVRDGDDALVVGRRGRVSVTVRCDDSMRLDTVFLPFHFAGDARANLLTNPALDPTSRMRSQGCARCGWSRPGRWPREPGGDRGQRHGRGATGGGVAAARTRPGPARDRGVRCGAAGRVQPDPAFERVGGQHHRARHPAAARRLVGPQPTSTSAPGCG